MILFALTYLVSNIIGTPLWTQAQAFKWYNKHRWSIGFNYINRGSDNQIQMWRNQTFNIAQIDQQLNWAHQLGFSLLRVFLHIQPFFNQRDQFLLNMQKFLETANKHNHQTLFVLFDDCWNAQSKFGEQPQPIKGVHNSRWLQCPGNNKYDDSILKDYVQTILTKFSNDKRIIMYDLYNQPGNSGHQNNTYTRLKNVVSWARQVDMIQPITVGRWTIAPWSRSINQFILYNSDINSFHIYCDQRCTQGAIIQMKMQKRPFICTQYMARTIGSKFITHLPIFKKQRIWAINWGFVFGRIQTYMPWGSRQGDPVPQIWFHDVVYPNGKPFDQQQAVFIKNITKQTIQ